MLAVVAAENIIGGEKLFTIMVLTVAHFTTDLYHAVAGTLVILAEKTNINEVTSLAL